MCARDGVCVRWLDEYALHFLTLMNPTHTHTLIASTPSLVPSLSSTSHLQHHTYHTKVTLSTAHTHTHTHVFREEVLGCKQARSPSHNPSVLPATLMRAGWPPTPPTGPFSSPSPVPLHELCDEVLGIRGDDDLFGELEEESPVDDLATCGEGVITEEGRKGGDV